MTGFAYGDTGADILWGDNTVPIDYILIGGDGTDTLYFDGIRGVGDGGNQSDDYHIRTSALSQIQDTGIEGTDRVYVGFIDSNMSFEYGRQVVDGVLTDNAFLQSADSVLLLLDWYNGRNSIEVFHDGAGGVLNLDFDQWL
ncbi:hypothetical protein J7444_09210 [Labrenzia sp. R4_1]|uniref:hypothetical protein n=1 Tax=Labrenzia sp. R4_1 TaxID=2821106 RepID=UPI001ADD0272|nr:hypothetical protein [Labrenzia sp. R4_1]MBO9424900.1 hypothetical protein [Labrenzia sp. R4_1]